MKPRSEYVLPRLGLLLLALAIALTGCEPWPRDPEHTTEMVLQEGKLRIGIIHDPPWVDVKEGAPSGREVELLQEFAKRLGATPEWQVLGVHEGFKALENHEIDLLAGGLVHGMPYGNVGYTRPYRETRNDDGEVRMHVFAIRQGENRFLVALEKFLKEREGIVQ